jgi:hypothetical protein
VAAKGLDHLVGVVEKDYLGTAAGEGMGKFPRSAFSRVEPALAIR